MKTPRLLPHARERCAEMGISTKVAKAIVKAPAMTYCGKPGTDSRVAVSDDIPEYAVVFYPETEALPPIIVTVVFRTPDDYVRDGETYIPIPRKSGDA